MPFRCAEEDRLWHPQVDIDTESVGTEAVQGERRRVGELALHGASPQEGLARGVVGADQQPDLAVIGILRKGRHVRHDVRKPQPVGESTENPVSGADSFCEPAQAGWCPVKH